MSCNTARIVGWLYTLAVIAVAVRFTLRPLPSELEPLAWLFIITLAALPSLLLPSTAELLASTEQLREQSLNHSHRLTGRAADTIIDNPAGFLVIDSTVGQTPDDVVNCHEIFLHQLLALTQRHVLAPIG
jgi:hypothetical protein